MFYGSAALMKRWLWLYFSSEMPIWSFFFRFIALGREKGTIKKGTNAFTCAMNIRSILLALVYLQNVK